ncbi:MAG: helix-turn-helix domain-containing protein [Dehalococcoidia bacterium]|nr:helix-turn-helix domain-containing protein [Dehalococcoidia bacterium]
MDGTNFKDFKAQLLKDPKIEAEYEALKPKYGIIQAIITRRNELSISQRDLAKMTGMHQPAICRLERGDGGTTIETLVKIAGALNMDVDVRPKVEA